MKPVVLTDMLAVGEFPTPDQVAILAKAGFKSIFNNQPDGEVARFGTDAEVAAEAKRNGLVYAYAPLSSRTPPAEELERYAKAIAALPAPIYAFCYSGSRAAAACALLLTETTEVDIILREFNEAGFDLSGLKPWLEEARARHAPPKASADNNGNGSKPVNGAAAHGDNPAPPEQPQRATAGLPHMIVVQPRAAGYGGFAR